MMRLARETGERLADLDEMDLVDLIEWVEELAGQFERERKQFEVGRKRAKA